MSSKTDYVLTVGLEIHAELRTNTKMFCFCKNDTDERRPNINICPICMGHPGTLPTINKGAVKNVLKVGVAVGGGIADFTEFDRKNYFYPDIPKGYQLSQYKYPLVKGGELNGIKLTRVHLEEDTAKSTHDSGDYSLVDFNRAGVPLMELVTEPVIKSAEEAVNFAKELQLLLRYLGVAEANMEKGEMRVEANISVAPKGSKKFGTKVEVKNLNSFKSVEKAINFELNRHIEAIEGGEALIQETRGWDETKEETYSQRTKEDSHDYRYFPDPDLPKLSLSEVEDFKIDKIKSELPELPWIKRERYLKLGLKNQEAEILVGDILVSKFFDDVLYGREKEPAFVKTATNYLLTDLGGIVKKEKIDWKDLKIKPDEFSELVGLVNGKEISSRGAKDILLIMAKDGGSPAIIAEKNNLIQKSDLAEVAKIVAKVIAENSLAVEKYKSGKVTALQFLIGQCMKESKGSANPEIVRKELEKILS
ncbi:Asp-tRNA(Asn)/Glu-tRNA(Gln) amidotransferase subunit GatB [Candidatus Nomurabacteria bacterium]|nr:Asp-tRNA(Asn)/Glu-tRNA(Gln) amidotransferase subunit GatB [Candidatus Nomurabacteria bacterium]